jgi:trimeric autotransporter adhesin
LLVRKPWMLLTALFVLALAFSPAAGHGADFTRDTEWLTFGGTVSALAANQATLFLGGDFEYVGRATGGFLSVATADPTLVRPAPRVEGTVFAVAADGEGGWYIGGDFSAVDGIPRSNLAHIQNDGTLNEGWLPSVSGRIQALLVAGQHLYVGGTFASIDSQERPALASYNTTSGLLTEWQPGIAGSVNVIAAGNGRIYVGGEFNQVAGRPRNNVAAFEEVTGALSGWDPNAGATVRALAISGNTIYIGGDFLHVSGLTRHGLAAIDSATGAPAPWAPVAERDGSWSSTELVRDLVVRGDRLYALGSFSSIDGHPRPWLAAFDITTGWLDTWIPEVSGPVSAVAVGESTLYASASFSPPQAVTGAPAHQIVALDVVTGVRSGWHVALTHPALALALDEQTLYAGGSFTSANLLRRHSLASVSLADGAFTPWSPEVPWSERVAGLVAGAARLYVYGTFSSIDSQPRSGLAAFDANAGNLLPWNPTIQGSIYTLLLSNEVVYIGGAFTGVDGEPRQSLAAFDRATGALLDWDPQVDGSINALTMLGDTLYLGGNFSSVNGVTRTHLAAVDTTTGSLLPWNPVANNHVNTLDVAGDTIYVGGTFTSIGGQSRKSLAAVDAGTGMATDWLPNPQSSSLLTISVLKTSGEVIYTGGAFSTIGGQPRNLLAALDAETGVATAWNPAVRGLSSYSAVNTMALQGHTLYATHASGSHGARDLGHVAALDTRFAAITGAASDVTGYSARLHGVASVKDASATVRFQVTGVQGNYNDAIDVPGEPSTVSGTSTTNVQARVQGLQRGTVYHYRVVLIGSDGTTEWGQEQAFMTTEQTTLFLPLVAH